MKTPNQNESLYRSILAREYSARLRSNSRYSLRAFARDLAIGPARLSEILSGKVGLSRSGAEEVARHLGFSSAEVEQFCDSAEYTSGRSAARKEALRKKLNEKQSQLKQLPTESFYLISDPDHLLALEAFELSTCTGTKESLATLTGLEGAHLDEILERLQRVGLISRKGSQYKKTNISMKVGDGAPSSAIRHYHKMMLEKAKLAVNNQSTQERENAPMVFALSLQQVTEIKEALNEFRHRIREIANRTGDSRVSVNAINFQIFRLNEPKENP